MGWHIGVNGLAHNEARATETVGTKVGGYGVQPFFAGAFLGAYGLADLPDAVRVRARWVRAVWVGRGGFRWQPPDWALTDGRLDSRWYGEMRNKADFARVVTSPYSDGGEDEGIGVVAVEESIRLGLKMKPPVAPLVALGEFALQVMRTPVGSGPGVDQAGNDMPAGQVPALAEAFDAIEPQFDRLPAGWGEQLHDVNLVIRTAHSRGLGLWMG